MTAFVLLGLLSFGLFVLGMVLFMGSDYDERGKQILGLASRVASVIVGISTLFVLSHTLATHDHHYAECTVTEKDQRVNGAEGSGTLRIYTEECGTLTARDSFWYKKWRSADTYGSIKPGKRYRMEIAGHRNGAFSWFPNVLSAQEITNAGT